MKTPKSPALLLAGCLLLLLAACSPRQPNFEYQFLAFGTLMDLTIAGAEPARARHAAEVLEQDFAEMHRVWHAWSPGPMTRTNWLLSQGKPFSAPPSVLPLIQASQDLAAKSDNLFNPAIGRLLKLWGFESDDPNRSRPPPDPAAIQAEVDAKPRMSDITIDGFHLQSSNPAVQVDVGGIGKGYGIDLAIEHLREMGIENAIVNAGGDLRAIGRNGDRPWRIGIRGADGQGALGEVDVDGDLSVFTSGNYERYFEWQGKRYHHIIDPRTGYPAVGAKSVTVLHSDATTADAAATALLVAGPEDWPRIAARMGIKYVLLVDEQNVYHMTPAMQARLTLMNPNVAIRITPVPEVTAQR